MDIEVYKLVVPLLGGFVGAVLGTHLALSRTKKEKIWDEKRELYSKVIIALEDISYWAEQVRSEHCGEYTSRSGSNIEQSMREVQKLAVTGRLVMNDEFYGLLVAVNSALQKENFSVHEAAQEAFDNPQSAHLFRHALAVRDTVQEYLPKLIKSAKRELPKRT
ncbi:hypothetical protein BBM03_22845 [Vibrio parahaemolyticus]|uniref:hypothetical protein n=1 Tax=Vibrio parahaemolyticus TaxID=670 RepID=UPI00084B5FDF|nr:hypothetical protein [Vibrio parahaemolyticus]ODX30150.1 hypothetical protein BBM03_22845 [Vibrio parahaemolyticus]HAS6535098.1 hypothetical protein [Vibrio parahaemolyticus]HAS6554795.1 hypothetical protein [Vibrio parahaemolyticus]HAS6559750.1 hypothetical protein [Vibrio parahaemolyticus]